MILILVMLVMVVTATATAAPVIEWASSPVFADETVVVLGGPFSNRSKVALTPLSTSKTTTFVDPIQSSMGSLKFVVPQNWQEAQWSVSVDESPPHILNAPVLWWANGDEQSMATPGGHIRIYGSCVYHMTAAFKAAQSQLEKAEAVMADALSVLGTDLGAAGNLTKYAATLSNARRLYNVHAAATASNLRLTPVSGGASIVITSTPENTTSWTAFFQLPGSITPGEYNVQLSNSLAPSNFVELISFITPLTPRVNTITVQADTDLYRLKPWRDPKAKVFNVGDYGPYGLPPTNGSRVWTNASVAIEKAIAAAGDAGGGIVWFDRGTYFVNSSFGFEIPWGVQLQGEGKELVEIVFSRVYNVSDSGPIRPNSPGSGAIGLFRAPETGNGAWGISNLTVYVTGFHNSVFLVNNRTQAFEMTNARVTCNSFLGNWGPNTARNAASNWTWGLMDPGAAVTMNGHGFLIEDSDIYSDGPVITSTTAPNICPVQMGNKTGNAHCHGSSWGTIRNNRLFNGGSSHFMSQWQQIVFEQNEVVGISPVSGGNSLGTGPGGGYVQHVYHANNRVQFVWGGDREIVTYDDAGAAYLGPVAALSNDGLTLTLKDDARSSYSGEWGGWAGVVVSVLNGTGVGSWRRVVHAGIDDLDNEGEYFNINNRTWTIDRPFPFSLTEGQMISITPARARIIFENDHFLDGGTLQFYGQAQECVVQSFTGERITGVVAWGQWRGWYDPPCGTMGMPPCPLDVNRLGGQMGNGIMMNTQLTYLDNHFTVGNKIVRFDASDSSGSEIMGFQKFYNGATFNIQGVNIELPPPNCKTGTCGNWTALAATSAVVYRRNKVDSNGGFNIANNAYTTSIRDVVIESSTILKSDPDKVMQVSPKMVAETVVIRNNNIP